MKHVIKKTPKQKFDEEKDRMIQDLIRIYEKLNFNVRIEKGTFKGGFCLLKDQKLFLLNKNIDQDKKINFLVKNLTLLGTEDIYIKPNIRALIDSSDIGTES
ncbi:MAG: hypothetical protein OZ913_08535 [Ignavibacteriaceae bacterium]|nr:MAG: hypothetical protein EDM69_10165 [Chlorobiota bacterium]MBV6397848.1 hypothetical protein [Ignavibacteria bacterium]MCC6886898.1 hypothetical protein [Ignavibacteriales bacterium]MCE7953986.1 hypothetical protein [Chlorobi bacterium CHB7]MDL1887886.1 hypothetical protein [Ignavibacteria bacterium CHB1]MEB2330327.1 hypothetical protein [Ignavibacteriaceae bacterium]OQY76787.1 MAG: hypothetical protein B6D43_09155 [Ignavibacteriales bacterium UTCHB1]RIK47657.1 MAG: hypothetical protein